MELLDEGLTSRLDIASRGCAEAQIEIYTALGASSLRGANGNAYDEGLDSDF